MREIGKQSGVDILPQVASDIISFLMLEKDLGVVMAGVPGAGGEDALFVVGLKKEFAKSDKSLHERV